MYIPVRNTITDEIILNHSYAQVFAGVDEDHDLVMWDKIRDYIPLKMDGFSDWKCYSSVHGRDVYFCHSIK